MPKLLIKGDKPVDPPTELFLYQMGDRIDVRVKHPTTSDANFNTVISFYPDGTIGRSSCVSPIYGFQLETNGRVKMNN
jgi:hypothetical protein